MKRLVGLCAAGAIAGGALCVEEPAAIRHERLRMQAREGAAINKHERLRMQAREGAAINKHERLRMQARQGAAINKTVGPTLMLLGQQLPEPRKQFGASATGAFEGWFNQDDGSRSFLVGYFNRNTQQELDIPIGPNNQIEPGGPDMGQPTHFLPGRQWGMFMVPVPTNFTPQDKLTWTIIANGQVTSIPLRLNPDYVISPFSEIAVGNTPPVLRFEPNGPKIQGPVAMLDKAAIRTGSSTAPLAITVWVADDMKYTSGTSAPLSTPRPPLTLTWSKYRGPGTVIFDKARPEVEKLPSGTDNAAFSGKATTNVKFSEPGEYVLHVTINDYSGDGGGGFQCCWTTGLVKVSVKP